MRLFFICAGALVMASPGILVAQEHPQFKDHAFFKFMTGNWTCEGELKGADGGTMKIMERWKGEFVSANTLAIEGKREIDGRSEAYKWTFISNPQTGAIEAAYGADPAIDDTLRFEVSVSADGLKIEMTGMLDSGKAKVVVVQVFPKADHDRIEDKVTMSDESGTPVLTGELVNKRVKESAAKGP